MDLVLSPIGIDCRFSIIISARSMRLILSTLCRPVAYQVHIIVMDVLPSSFNNLYNNTMILGGNKTKLIVRSKTGA